MTSLPPTDRPPSNGEVAYCPGLEPRWLAFQDGDGAWARAQPTTESGRVVFRHVFLTNRGGVATATEFSNGLTSLSVLYGAPAELSIVGQLDRRACGSVVSKTLLGSVTGLVAGEFAFVSAGALARALVIPNVRDEFSLGGLTEGPQDILAVRTPRLDDGAAITSIILRRNLSLPDSAVLPAFDFSSAEAFAPAVRTVTVTGSSARGAVVSTRLNTANSVTVTTTATIPTTAATRLYYSIPEERLQSSDVQALFASSTEPAGNASRTAAVFFRSPVDRTLALGELVAAPTFATLATAPVLRLRARVAPQTDYDRLATISYQQGENTLLYVSMTPAYATLAGSSPDLAIPDLSTVEGFNPSWALRSGGGSLLWSLSRIGGTLGLGLDVVPTNGATQRTAFVSGTVTTP